jgi:hypothetical protein
MDLQETNGSHAFGNEPSGSKICRELPDYLSMEMLLLELYKQSLE